MLSVMVAPCPVCDGSPRVLVAVRHPVMGRYIRELLEREHHCWTGDIVGPGERLADAVDRVEPDLVVVDSADLPACCRSQLAVVPPTRVLVIGPEPDAAYERAAFALGAGAWLSREDVGDGLGPALRSVLGCVHDPCPEPTEAVEPRADKTTAG